MAATIITVTKVGDSRTSIQIKINDACPVPNQIVTDVIQSFRTWTRQYDHIFVWTNDQEHELVMAVPHQYVGWVLSAAPTGGERDRFKRYNLFLIDGPCTVAVEEES